VTALRTDFVQRFSPRRAVAFAAALAVALSTLVTSYVAARAAADAIVDPFNIICHAGNPSTAPQPGEGEGDGDGDGGAAKPHVDCCSLGCMTAMAAPPLRIALPIAHQAGRILSWAVTAAAPDPAPSRSYRSRAPPQQA
jgi:hypothetical protein